MKKLLLLFLLMLFFIPSANADVVWPSLYIVSGILSLKTIVAGILVETVFVKIFAKLKWPKAFLITLLMNLVSCIAGIILIPISGLIIEFLLIPVKTGTFHWSHWLLSYIAAILLNTSIEGITLKLIIKENFTKIFWWLFLANAVSIIFCVIHNLNN